MKGILRNSVALALVAATTLAALPASAQDRWRDRDHRRPVIVERHDGGELLAAGILGLAAGAIIAGIATQPRPVYREPAYRHPQNYPRPSPDRQNYYPAAPDQYRSEARYSRSYAPEPWSRDWFRYCEQRYRSFDPHSGTFMGYDGVRRFCNAN